MEDFSFCSATIISHIQHAFEAQACWREHALIHSLKSAQVAPFSHIDLSNTLELFKAHFLVRHALYTLRGRWRSTQQAELRISSIELEKVQYRSDIDTHNQKSTDVAQQDLLAAYYLDIENYHEMTEAEVNLLLKGFWQQLQSPAQSADALNTLGLNEGATYREIKAAFRKAAQTAHPDKGGDESRFKSLVEAKEQLLNS